MRIDTIDTPLSHNGITYRYHLNGIVGDTPESVIQTHQAINQLPALNTEVGTRIASTIKSSTRSNRLVVFATNQGSLANSGPVVGGLWAPLPHPITINGTKYVGNMIVVATQDLRELPFIVGHEGSHHFWSLLSGDPRNPDTKLSAPDISAHYARDSSLFCQLHPNATTSSDPQVRAMSWYIDTLEDPQPGGYNLKTRIKGIAKNPTLSESQKQMAAMDERARWHAEIGAHADELALRCPGALERFAPSLANALATTRFDTTQRTLQLPSGGLMIPRATAAMSFGLLDANPDFLQLRVTTNSPPVMLRNGRQARYHGYIQVNLPGASIRQHIASTLLPNGNRTFHFLGQPVSVPRSSMQTATTPGVRVLPLINGGVFLADTMSSYRRNAEAFPDSWQVTNAARGLRDAANHYTAGRLMWAALQTPIGRATAVGYLAYKALISSPYIEGVTPLTPPEEPRLSNLRGGWVEPSLTEESPGVMRYNSGHPPELECHITDPTLQNANTEFSPNVLDNQNSTSTSTNHIGAEQQRMLLDKKPPAITSQNIANERSSRSQSSTSSALTSITNGTRSIFQHATSDAQLNLRGQQTTVAPSFSPTWFTAPAPYAPSVTSPACGPISQAELDVFKKNSNPIPRRDQVPAISAHDPLIKPQKTSGQKFFEGAMKGFQIATFGPGSIGVKFVLPYTFPVVVGTTALMFGAKFVMKRLEKLSRHRRDILQNVLKSLKENSDEIEGLFNHEHWDLDPDKLQQINKKINEGKQKIEHDYRTILDRVNKHGDISSESLEELESHYRDTMQFYNELGTAIDQAITDQPERLSLFKEAQFFNQAQTLIKENKVTEAIKLCDQALTELPDNPTLLSLRARLIADSKPETAQQDLDKIKLDDKCSKDFIRQCNEAQLIIYFKLNKHSDALALCDILLSGNPDHQLAIDIKANTLLITGHLDEAEQAFKKLSSLDPSNAETQENCRDAFAMISQIRVALINECASAANIVLHIAMFFIQQYRRLFCSQPAPLLEPEQAASAYNVFTVKRAVNTTGLTVWHSPRDTHGEHRVTTRPKTKKLNSQEKKKARTPIRLTTL